MEAWARHGAATWRGGRGAPGGLNGGSHSAQQCLIAPLSRKRCWRNSRSSRGRRTRPLRAKMLAQVLRAVPKRASQGALLPPPVGATPTTCAAGRSWRDRGQQPPGLPGACGERLPLEGRGMLAQRPCEPRSEASPGPRVRPRAEWSGLWGHVVKGQPCHCPVLWANPITSQALFSSSLKWGLPS